MFLKKIVLTTAMLTLGSLGVAKPLSEGELFLLKKPQPSSVIPSQKGFPGNGCIEACYDEYDRCIDQVGNRPGGSFWCGYNQLMCVDACEGIGN